MRDRQITKIFMGSLVLLLITGAKLRQASGQSPTDIGPNTFELISYQSSGYKFKIIDQKAKPPDRFEQPGFNDTGFDTSSAAFGSGGACPLQLTVQTNWPVNSQLLARHEVTIPTETTNIRVMVSVDNNIRVFFNGKPLLEHTHQTTDVIHEGCPIRDEFRFDVPQELVRPGQNLVVFQARDRGVESFFDARLLADLLPDQLLEAVAVQQTPLVPVRDVAVDFSTDATGAQRSATITYTVAATGEFGEIRLEQISEETLTAATFLGGELMAFGTATPDGMTMSRSLRAAERLTDFDPGILSAPSVLTNQTALEGLFQFIATPAESSCEAGCNLNARLSALFASLVGGSLVGGSRSLPASFFAGGLIAALDTTTYRRIQEARNQCIAACMTPPGTLSGTFTYVSPGGLQAFTFSGRLVHRVGATGMATFELSPVVLQLVDPGLRVIDFRFENLTAGTWEVTGSIAGITQTCSNVRVPGFIRIDKREPFVVPCQSDGF